ncbi:hypothetical protein BDW59DRAFT_167503 [Aspergillus cavernicola]|uniref:Uncharacterized protein n=1 Tax=Aspergillus cavernicola TaxID=176166 RepID=A0ABR4HDE1_9EURO
MRARQLGQGFILSYLKNIESMFDKHIARVIPVLDQHAEAGTIIDLKFVFVVSYGFDVIIAQLAAMASPNPDAAPVTIATLPSKRPFVNNLDAFSSRVADRYGLENTAATTFALGAVAGTITVYATQPFDTIKTRSQAVVVLGLSSLFDQSGKMLKLGVCGKEVPCDLVGWF